MHHHRIADLLRGSVPPGEAVTLAGWVRTRRDSKAGLSFINLHDGSGFAPIQVVAQRDLPNYENEIQRLTTGASAVVHGTLVETPGRPQPVEVHATSVEVVGLVDDPETYPIQPKQHSMEFLREVAHLRIRTNTFGAVARVRHALSMAVHRFYDQRGFFWVHTPIITTSDAEGAGEMFRVTTLDLANLPRTADGRVDFAQDFFGTPAYLTVSGQLERGDVRHGAQQGLHVRPHVPRREQQHHAPRGRVLDDRAGDGVRRPERRRGPGGGLHQVHLPRRC